MDRKRMKFNGLRICIVLLAIGLRQITGQATCNNGQGRVLYERLPNQQLQGFDDDVVRDTAPPFRVLEKCQDLCLRDRTASNNLVRACTSFDFQPGSRIASFSGNAEYEESTCYLTREQAAPEGIGNLMLVPNSVHFTEVCLASSRPERECPSRRYVFERHPRKKLKLPVSDVKEMTAANRSDCEDKCLNEFSFVCRSANYDATMRSCSLSRFTRRTHPELMEDDPNSDYLENTCLNAERRCDGLAIFVKEENKKLGGPFEVDIFNNMTLDECQMMCMRAEKYFCRSVEFDDQTKQCILSEEDSISQKDDISISSSPSHHFYDLVCLDNQRGSEYPDNSVTSHLFSGGRRPDTAFQRYRNSRLGGEFHSEITGRTLSECLDECLRQISFQCRSAVYSERYRTCRLSRYNQKDGMRIIYDADYDYYENLMLGTETEDGDRPGGRPGADKDQYPDDRYNTNNNNNNNQNNNNNRPYDRYPQPGYPADDGRYPSYNGDRHPGGAPGGGYPANPDDRYAAPGYPGGDRFPGTYPGADRYPTGGGDRYPAPGGDRYGPSGGDRFPGSYPGMDRYPPGGERYPGGPGGYPGGQSGYPGGPGGYPGGQGGYPGGPGAYPAGPSGGYPGGPMDRPPPGMVDRYPMPGMPPYDNRYPPVYDNRLPMDGGYPPIHPNRYPMSAGGGMAPIDARYPMDNNRYPGPMDGRYPMTPIDGRPLVDGKGRYPEGPEYYPPRGRPSTGKPPVGYPTGRYPVDTDHRYAPGPGGAPFNSGPSGPPPIDSRFPPTSENRFPVGNERFPVFIYKYGNRERFPSGTGMDRFGGYDQGYDRTFGPSGGYPYPQNQPAYYDRDRQYPRPPMGIGNGGFQAPPTYPNYENPYRPQNGGGGPHPPSGYDNNVNALAGDGFGGYGPTRPQYGNRCDDEGFKQAASRHRMRRPYIRRAINVPSLTHCQRECLDSRDFMCRSFNYREGVFEAETGPNCEMSDKDSREMDLQDPMLFDVGTYDFYERSFGRNGEECLDVSQTCSEDGMEFTLRTPDGFVGRIYTYGFYDRCFFRGNGGTANVLRISGPQGYPECGSQRFGDTMTNIVVVQFSDNVQTGRDKRFNLTCLFRGPGESVVTSGYIGAGSGSPIPIEYLPAENTLNNRVRLLILYQGRPTTTIAVGDPLTFRLESQDNFKHASDIFATNVIARDPYSGRSVQLIDRHGCPVNSFVFPELDKLRDGETLEARFNAFKIPESNFLVFEATVKTCRDGCQPAYCPGPSGRSEPSFGRRKRDVNGTLISSVDSSVNDTDTDPDSDEWINVSSTGLESTDSTTTDPDSENTTPETPEQVREMIEVFESREEMESESFARKIVAPQETICLTPSEYHGLISAVILLMILLLSITLAAGFAYRRYWGVVTKNRVIDRNSPIHSFSPSHTLSNNQFNARSTSTSTSANGNARPALSLFSGQLHKTFATGNLSRMCQIPVINPIRTNNNSSEFDDPSEPIYTDPSLFERSRSLRSINVQDQGDDQLHHHHNQRH